MKKLILLTILIYFKTISFGQQTYVDQFPISYHCQEIKDEKRAECFKMSLYKFFNYQFKKRANISKIGEGGDFNVLFKVSDSGKVVDLKIKGETNEYLSTLVKEIIERFPIKRAALKEHLFIETKFEIPFKFTSTSAKLDYDNWNVFKYSKLTVFESDLVGRLNKEYSDFTKEQLKNGVQPIYKGCEYVPTEERMACFSKKANEFIFSNLKSKLNKSKGGRCKLFVKFIIEKDGRVSNVKPLGIGNEYIKNLCKEIVSDFPRFTPGKVNNIPVSTQFRVPININ